MTGRMWKLAYMREAASGRCSCVIWVRATSVFTFRTFLPRCTKVQEPWPSSLFIIYIIIIFYYISWSSTVPNAVFMEQVLHENMTIPKQKWNLSSRRTQTHSSLPLILHKHEVRGALEYWLSSFARSPLSTRRVVSVWNLSQLHSGMCCSSVLKQAWGQPTAGCDSRTRSRAVYCTDRHTHTRTCTDTYSAEHFMLQPQCDSRADIFCLLRMNPSEDDPLTSAHSSFSF